MFARNIWARFPPKNQQARQKKKVHSKKVLTAQWEGPKISNPKTKNFAQLFFFAQTRLSNHFILPLHSAPTSLHSTVCFLHMPQPNITLSCPFLQPILSVTYSSYDHSISLHQYSLFLNTHWGAVQVLVYRLRILCIFKKKQTNTSLVYEEK